MPTVTSNLRAEGVEGQADAAARWSVARRGNDGCVSEDVSEKLCATDETRARSMTAYRAHLNFRGSALTPIIDRTTLANIAPGLSRRPAWRARPAVACLFRREKTTTPLFARAEGEKARRRIFRRVRVGQDFSR